MKTELKNQLFRENNEKRASFDEKETIRCLMVRETAFLSLSVKIELKFGD